MNNLVPPLFLTRVGRLVFLSAIAGSSYVYVCNTDSSPYGGQIYTRHLPSPPANQWCECLPVSLLCFFLNHIPEKKCNGFRCPNGTCIPSSKHCDGLHDCSDGLDEQHCGESSPCLGGALWLWVKGTHWTKCFHFLSTCLQLACKCGDPKFSTRTQRDGVGEVRFGGRRAGEGVVVGDCGIRSWSMIIFVQLQYVLWMDQWFGIGHLFLLLHWFS